MQALTFNTTLGIEKKAFGQFQPDSISHLKQNIGQLLNEYEDLYPISRGFNWGYGCRAPISSTSCVIDLSKCREIRFFDEQHGVVTVEPGVTYGQLSEFLQDRGDEWLCPVHGGGPNTSVLGNLVERGYGITPLTDHFQSLISLEALLKDGSTYKSPFKKLGQERLSQLFKYGIGPYTDGLFTQSGLGIVTQVTIKLAPKSEHIEMFFASFKEETTLKEIVPKIKKLKQTLGSQLGGINLMNRERVLSMTMDYPYEKILSGEPLSPEEIDAAGRRLKVTNWTMTGAFYGPRSLSGPVRKMIKQELKGLTCRSLFYNTQTRPWFLQLEKLLKFFGFKDLSKALGTIEQGFQILNGRPNNVALRLAYWKHENQELKKKPTLNPTQDGCGLIWYAPLVEMNPTKVKEYTEFVRTTAEKHAQNPLITLTTIDDLCFDSTVPILFNRNNQEDTERSREFHKELLHEGARRGYFPYRLNIETQQEFDIQTEFLNFPSISKYRYR